jgi:hypothetical protein
MPMYGMLRLKEENPQSLKELMEYMSRVEIPYEIINASESVSGSKLGNLFVFEYSDWKEKNDIVYHMRDVLDGHEPLEFLQIKDRDSLNAARLKVEGALKVVARVQLDFMSKLDQKFREMLASGELNSQDLYRQLASALFKD